MAGTLTAWAALLTAATVVGCPAEGPTTVDVSVTLTGAGSGSVTTPTDGVEISCPATCRDRVKDAGGGGRISLNATADPGSRFVGWEHCTSTDGTACVLEYTDDGRGSRGDCDDAVTHVCFTVRARFEPIGSEGERGGCDNGADDDDNNATDCADASCCADAGCSCAEVCDNGVDDDRNGDTDCGDLACELDPACTTPPPSHTPPPGCPTASWAAADSVFSPSQWEVRGYRLSNSVLTRKDEWLAVERVVTNDGAYQEMTYDPTEATASGEHFFEVYIYRGGSYDPAAGAMGCLTYSERWRWRGDPVDAEVVTGPALIQGYGTADEVVYAFNNYDSSLFAPLDGGLPIDTWYDAEVTLEAFDTLWALVDGTSPHAGGAVDGSATGDPIHVGFVRQHLARGTLPAHAIDDFAVTIWHD